ncbi:AraC family transcriptional regulator ligand-binding domain-containing protein [Comamonadaceae bacterium G21597-S1]|nr:AraC family transcriptional regulator ligand-binding domain-containing protein [Comamonadaceae bacterium G21597-S1]
MHEITSLFAHKVIAQADAGLDRRSLYAAVGLDADAPVDPRQMVSDVDYYALFAMVARCDPAGASLPLRVGASMRCADYGAFGLAWKSALDLLGSWQRAERYARVLTSVASYQVHTDADGVWMQLHRDGDRDRNTGLRLSNEATVASIAAISGEVSGGRFKASAVYFRHAAPSSVAAHVAHFGCPVVFDAGMDALRVPWAVAQTPNQVGDPAIVQFFDRHLDAELAQRDDDTALARRVRTQVARSLSQGVPTLSDVATQFGMSARTLQRRLSDQGHAYQAVVDAARRELAQQLLRETRYPLAEVAFLTGFSEQSAFNRAFKRWAGQTPRSYRIEARPAPD